MSAEEDLIDYSDEEIGTNEVAPAPAANGGATKDGAATKVGIEKKGGYAGIHTTGFRDFLLKPELLRALTDCGFEHPSEIQQAAIPQAMLGSDVICQAKSGFGKTAIFCLVSLQQLDPVEGETSVVVMCHTRELAYQIQKEYERFAKYMPEVRTSVFYGGAPIQKDIEIIKNKATHPHIVVATPGRLNALVRDKVLRLGSLKIFVLDECDKMLDQPDMRRDVQDIFKTTPVQKQVMMFSATLSKTTKPICEKFMRNPIDVTVRDGDEAKLNLDGLIQSVLKVDEKEKNRKLNEILDFVPFNQVIIFVKSTLRATELDKLLRECNFPSVAVHSGVSQEERIKRYNEFKQFEKRICVATDVFGRGIDIQRINLAINYDMPDAADAYLHRVGRAGRFGTRGWSVSFISSEADETVKAEIERRFNVALPDYTEDLINKTSSEVLEGSA